MASPYTAVGSAQPRLDGAIQATGKAIFGVDLNLPGLLHGKLLRSPFPHARILKLDASRARRLSGVKAVVTAAESPAVRYGFVLKDQTLFARDKVRFAGERVAAVAAVSEEVAEEALRLIQVSYEELPAVFDPLEAMAPQAPLVHEELAAYEGFAGPPAGGNVCAYGKLSKGDVEQGFRESEMVFEDTFQLPAVHQCYLEPHAAMASLSPAGKVTVWSNTQGPYMVRAVLAEIFDLPLHQVRVISTHIGGAFGGKGFVLLEPICVLLARASAHPVKIIMGRGEEFCAAQPRHPCLIQLKTGVRRDGTLVARQAKIVFDTGVSAGFKPHPIPGGMMRIGGPYRIPHVSIEAYCVYTHKTSFGQFRAPGDPQVAFASESQIDTIAHRLGIDPLELRLKNAAAEGEASPIGERWQGVGFRETLMRASSLINWSGRGAQPGRGLGIACSERTTGAGTASAIIKVNEDGTVLLATGTTDTGTGSATILPQIAAEELGLPIGQVALAASDTDSSPHGPSSGGSMVTFTAGNAVRRAAADARQQLYQLAASQLEASIDDLEVRDGRIAVRGSPDKGLTLAQLARLSHQSQGGPIIGRGSFVEKVRASPTFSTQIAEVEVDGETGGVRLLRLVTCHDVGTVINPLSAAGQIEGSAGQGLGYGLMEELLFEQGLVRNPNLATYRLPTALDVPAIASLMVEGYLGKGPFGAKGVGEAPVVATAAAIANAIFAAVGIRIKTLPLTPEKIWQALQGQGR